MPWCNQYKTNLTNEVYAFLGDCLRYGLSSLIQGTKIDQKPPTYICFDENCGYPQLILDGMI